MAPLPMADTAAATTAKPARSSKLVSWDYGLGKTHHNPPFLFALINFAMVFAFILSRAVRPRASRPFLENRHGEVRHARILHATCSRKPKSSSKASESRIAGLKPAVNASSLAGYRKQAEAERQTIKRAEEERPPVCCAMPGEPRPRPPSPPPSPAGKAALMAVDSRSWCAAACVMTIYKAPDQTVCRSGRGLSHLKVCMIRRLTFVARRYAQACSP